MRKYVSFVALAGVALALAACGQTPNPVNPTPQANGTLQVVLQGIGQAPVTVQGASGAVFTGAVTGQKDLSLPAGTYFVDGAPTSGFSDPSPMAVTVPSGQVVKAYLPYVTQQAASGNVANLTVDTITDPSGAVPMQPEVNPAKPVNLYAAQTEEPVVVRVRATDAGGAPVTGANVAVTLNEMFGDHVAIIRGAATSMLGTMSKSAIKPLAFRDGITTDANGIATFTLFATYGMNIGDPALSDIQSILMLFNQPAKIVVAAENDNSTAVLNEFKVFFYNLAHMYFVDKGQEFYTGQRLGKVFDRTNIFKPLSPTNLHAGDPLANIFTDGVRLYEKQPHVLVSDFNSCLGLMHLEYTLSAPSLAHTHFIEGTYAQVLHVDPTTLKPDVVAAPLGWDVQVAPDDNIGLVDLPVSASVKTDLVVTPSYGETTYTFLLKSFTVDKHWHGSYLTITKSVDHHVLTWAGEQHHLAFVAPNEFIGDPNRTNLNRQYNTLLSVNDPAVQAGSVFTATMTMTITNSGQDPVFNVTMADALPPELGVISSTITPAGGTYDSVNHVITWNYQTVNDPVNGPLFDQLPPGGTITGTFQVYLRQKPGAIMDAAALQKALHYQVKPLLNEDGDDAIDSPPEYEVYTDPYPVYNGDQQNDVTGTWFTGAALGQGGWEAKVDFLGENFKNDVVIWGVRPEFTIDKIITYPTPSVMPAGVAVNGAPVVNVGDIAYYRITATNVDLTGAGLRYHGLFTTYPAEFSNTAGQRDNPYGRNVRITDLFEDGLDFVSAGPLALVGQGTTIAGQMPNFDGINMPKGLYWDLVSLMGGGDVLTTDMQLRADLPNITKVELNTLKATPTCLGVNCQYDPGWWNCVFLDADNLNQPAKILERDGDFDPLSVQYLQYPDWQIENYSWNGLQPVRYSWINIHRFSDMYAPWAYGIFDCVPLRVILEGSPFIEPTLRGEFTTDDPLQEIKQNPRVNDNYFLQYLIKNNGGVTAINLVATISMAPIDGGSNHVEYADMNMNDYLVYRSPNLVAWTLTTIHPAAATSTSVSFPALDLPSGEWVLYAVPVRAISAGTEMTTAEETYQNHDGQLDPQYSTDPTNIQ